MSCALATDMDGGIELRFHVMSICLSYSLVAGLALASMFGYRLRQAPKFFLPFAGPLGPVLGCIVPPFWVPLTDLCRMWLAMAGRTMSIDHGTCFECENHIL